MQQHAHVADDRPAIEFNPLAPGFDQNPYPVYQRLREEAPIYYWEQGHAWVITRYEDILSVIRDDRFTADRAAWELASTQGASTLVPEFDELSRSSLLSASDRDHTRLRKLVSPAFTPRAIERLRPEIQRVVDETLESSLSGDTYDVARDFAELIPLRVIRSMLKIPKEHEATFKRFADVVLELIVLGARTVPPERAESMRAAFREGMALVEEVIEDRRRNPLEDDMLTTLIRTEEQGDRLSKAELVSLVTTLIVAGSETTVHMIDFVLLNLLRSPDVRAQVQAAPELLRSLVDEVLRYDHFGKSGLMRYALEDLDLKGTPIKKGQMVLLILGSGLRDGAAFPDPDKLDLRRDNGASIAFGNGAHFCLGASLARLEGEIAVGTLLRRFPDMQIEGEPVFGPHFGIRRIESIKVRLHPAGA